MDGHTHAEGGLGDKSTLSISRIWLSGLVQNCRGLSPGTGNASSRACCSLPRPDQTERADAEAVRRVAAAPIMEVNFMLCAEVWYRRGVRFWG